MPRSALLTAVLVTSGLAAPAVADDVRYFEKDGITYRETRRVQQQPLLETRLEARETTVMREKVSTELKEVDRTYNVPITEYQWVPYWQTSWNPFTQPFLAYRQMAVTRWETRSEKVRVPVTHRDLVPEKQTHQVPVTRQRMAEREFVTREPVGVGGAGAPLVGLRPTLAPTGAGTDPFAQPRTLGSGPTVGGVNKLENDPPREGSDWRPSAPALRR